MITEKNSSYIMKIGTFDTGYEIAIIKYYDLKEIINKDLEGNIISLTININNGIFCNTNIGDKILLNAARDNEATVFSISNGINSYEGSFILKKFNLYSTYDLDVVFSVTLESTGKFTIINN